jgi:hypothetical protein
MFVELEKDAQAGQKSSIALNTDQILYGNPGVQRGIGGQATTMITFVNQQQIVVVGVMATVLKTLTAPDASTIASRVLTPATEARYCRRAGRSTQSEGSSRASRAAGTKMAYT